MQTLTETRYVEASHSIVDTSGSASLPDWGMRVLGLCIVAVVPAAFWTAIAAWIAPAFGFALTAATLAITFATIAGFLTCVFAAISGSKRQYA